MAPETLSGKEKKNSSSVDVWSCGIMLFYMLFGYLPFKGGSSSDIIKDIVKQPLKFP